MVASPSVNGTGSGGGSDEPSAVQIEGRSAVGLCAWLAATPDWRDQICRAVLDLSGPWRLAFDTMLPAAGQVADPFHLV